MNLATDRASPRHHSRHPRLRHLQARAHHAPFRSRHRRQRHPVGEQAASRKSKPTCTCPAGTSSAKARDADMYAAIDGLVDKLDRQIIKHKEKVTRAPPERRRRATALSNDAARGAGRGASGKRLRRSPPSASDEPHFSSAHRVPRRARPRRPATRRRCSSTPACCSRSDSGLTRAARSSTACSRASAGLDRPRPGHRDSARPRQGTARGGRRVHAAARARFRSTRRTSSP